MPAALQTARRNQAEFSCSRGPAKEGQKEPETSTYAHSDTITSVRAEKHASLGQKTAAIIVHALIFQTIIGWENTQYRKT